MEIQLMRPASYMLTIPNPNVWPSLRRKALSFRRVYDQITMPSQSVFPGKPGYVSKQSYADELKESYKLRGRVEATRLEAYLPQILQNWRYNRGAMSNLLIIYF